MQNRNSKVDSGTSASLEQNGLLPAVPFRAKDKTNKAYNIVVVTKIIDDSVLAHTTFADGYRKYERKILLKDLELITAHTCNPDSFNKHCQTCGRYCG